MENDKKDVNLFDDMVDYLADAIAGEKHLLETFIATKDKNFMEIAMDLRKDRSKWMYRIVKEGKGEIYCINKHLLGCSSRLIEMGNRFLEQNNKQLAEECFEEAHKWEAVVKILNNEEGGEKNVQFSKPNKS